MSKKYIFWLILAMCLVFSLTLIPNTVSYEEPIKEDTPVITLSHAQDTWIRALEWCESAGKVEAINPEDLDGTPSYYSFQWKPSTFKHFSILYKILPDGKDDEYYTAKMSDYNIQRQIIDTMVLDQENINWDKQFPGCVKKLGYPPVS